jgi:hypothetical protein
MNPLIEDLFEYCINSGIEDWDHLTLENLGEFLRLYDANNKFPTPEDFQEYVGHWLMKNLKRKYAIKTFEELKDIFDEKSREDDAFIEDLFKGKCKELTTQASTSQV